MAFKEVSLFYPNSSVLKGYIEKYQLLQFDDPVEVKTIPNGRVDAWINLEGSFEWWYKESNLYKVLPEAGFFPLTLEVNKARSHKKLVCISIKFYPHILMAKELSGHDLSKPISLYNIFDKVACKKLTRQLRTVDISMFAALLDTFFLEQLFHYPKQDFWIKCVIEAIENGVSSQIKMDEIAREQKISIKTLERRFKKILGISPKYFAGLIQLQQATGNIRRNEKNLYHGNLTEALGFGYYDQSHFIKVCKKITGLSPKKLFTQLPRQITDIIIV